MSITTSGTIRQNRRQGDPDQPCIIGGGKPSMTVIIACALFLFVQIVS
jgi:hypothetical protein